MCVLSCQVADLTDQLAPMPIDAGPSSDLIGLNAAAASSAAPSHYPLDGPSGPMAGSSMFSTMTSGDAGGWAQLSLQAGAVGG